MRKTFQFKQFSLNDGKSAMKLSTDAVLIGAFAEIRKSKNILDVGTGSGIIALILAQRSGATITGIDPHEGSTEDAKQNFRNSPWQDRLFVVQSSIQEYADTKGLKFDHIISNPPFFTNSLLSADPGKNISKHDCTLRFIELLENSIRLLNPDGILSLILPAREKEQFGKQATSFKLNLHRETTVYPKPSLPFNRVLLDFRFTECKSPEFKSITIRQEDNQYTESYKKYTQAFYLNF